MGYCAGDGVILRTRDYKERDRLLTLYAPEFGRVALVADGAKRPGSRFGAALELGSIVAAEWYQSDPDSLGRLSAVTVKLHLEPARADLRVYAHLNLLLDGVIQLAEGSDHRAIYAALAAELDRLARGTADPATLLGFSLTLLGLTGHAPQTGCCVLCRTPAATGGFSATEGGLVCAACRPRAAAVEPAIWAALRRETATRAGILAALALLPEYVAIQYERELKSWTFYRQQWFSNPGK